MLITSELGPHSFLNKTRLPQYSCLSRYPDSSSIQKLNMSQRCQTFISFDMNNHVGCSLTEEKRDGCDVFMARSA